VWGCRPPRPRYRGGPRTPSPATRGLPQLAGNPALKPTPHPPGRARGLRPQLAGTRPQAAARAPSGRSWLANVLMCVWIFSGTGYSFARFAVTRPNRLRVSFVFFLAGNKYFINCRRIPEGIMEKLFCGDKCREFQSKTNAKPKQSTRSLTQLEHRLSLVEDQLQQLLQQLADSTDLTLSEDDLSSK